MLDTIPIRHAATADRLSKILAAKKPDMVIPENVQSRIKAGLEKDEEAKLKARYDFTVKAKQC